MTALPIQPPAERPSDSQTGSVRVAAAITEIVSAMGLRSSARHAIREFVQSLQDDAKLPHVSLYPAKTRAGVSYRITYRVPGYRRRTERLGKAFKPAYARARRVSEILQQVAAKMMKTADAFRVLYVDTTPIDGHLQDFIRSIKTKGRTERYLSYLEVRLRRMVELASYRRLTDITLASVTELTDKLRGYVEPESGKPLTPSTINDYLSLLRQLTRWAKGVGRLTEDPIAGSAGVKNTAERRRRDVLLDEMTEIVGYARLAAGTVRHMSGRDRAMLYLVAFATGFRRAELRAIEFAWLKLDARTITLPASVTKNGKEATQPLPTWLADELRDWLADRSGGGKLFPSIPLDTADLFDRDREGARAAWVDLAQNPKERAAREASSFLKRSTVDGDLVFHSLRHAYATALVANLDLKSAQILTRHATVSMLADRYAHGRHEKSAAGVEKSIANPIRKETA